MNRSFKRTRCVPRCACIDYSAPAKPSVFHQASEEKKNFGIYPALSRTLTSCNR